MSSLSFSLYYSHGYFLMSSWAGSGWGKFYPSFSRNLTISHHLFADDVLIFGKANSNTLGALNSSLSSLKSAYGMSMNINKSLIFFTKGTSNILNLCNLINHQLGSFTIKYMGIPLLDSNLKADNFSPLLDKIYSWLAGWKSKFLSFRGFF